MPSFDFSLPKKKVSQRNTSKNNNLNKIIKKNVTGVIWINSDAEYTVSINEGGVSFKYPIHYDCYSCKGHARIYRRGVPFKDRYVYIRSAGEYGEQNLNSYLPFAPGCVVLGDLVKTPINVSPLFIIKDCWTELNNEESHDALMFYKEHIDEINEIIRKQSIE